jgi:DNA polymerase elongation subunit (family B)
LEVYTQIKNERIEAKHAGNKLKDKTLKLSINGLSGNLQSQFSWCYSPETVMKIRINGQLFLLMLAERLIAAGCKILQANTDGLFVLRKKADESKFQAACKEWEQLTKLTLEEDRFERFYQFAINDYLAISEGYAEKKDSKLLKKKGLFIDSVTLGKGMAPMIIPKAIDAYFADGIPVEKTIRECKNLNDFITYQKVSKEFSVEYNNQLITHINRYYVSTNGAYLYKCKLEKVNDQYKRVGYINMLKDSGVTLCNNLEEFKEFPTNINYTYYIKEAKKIINKFEVRQLSLF